MITINEHYLKLQASYLFSDIAKRVSSFQEANPDREVIKLGIGDVTRALPKICIDAFHTAVDELASEVDVSPERVNKWLLQEWRVAPATQRKVASVLGVEQQELFVPVRDTGWSGDQAADGNS